MKRELGIKNVFFIGGVDDISKASYYRVCDVFVLPAIFLNSLYEGISKDPGKHGCYDFKIEINFIFT